MKRLFCILGLVALVLSAAALVSFLVLDLGPLKTKADSKNTTIWEEIFSMRGQDSFFKDLA